MRADQARIARIDLGRDHAEAVALALDVLALLDGPAPGLSEYREVWDDTVPPGGRVCSICHEPVESEPCPEHAPIPWQLTSEGLNALVATEEGALAEQRHQMEDPAVEAAFTRLAPRRTKSLARQSGGAR